MLATPRFIHFVEVNNSLIGLLTVFAAATLLGPTAHAQAPAAGAQQQIEAATRALPGNENTWYVINTQEYAGNSKARGHTVQQGKIAAATFIVNFINKGLAPGSEASTRRWTIEPYANQALAQQRAMWWRNYDQMAGYR